jgi:polar amino acid transport system substrate-binding protein
VTSSLTKREIQGLVQGESDLASVRVGVMTASAAQDYLARQHIPAQGYANAIDGLKALQAGRIDALVYDKPLLKWLVFQGFSSSLRVLDTTFAEQNYAIAFPKGSALREKVDPSVLDTIESEWWGQTLFQYLGGR